MLTIHIVFAIEKYNGQNMSTNGVHPAHGPNGATGTTQFIKPLYYKQTPVGIEIDNHKDGDVSKI